jgi:hypothetical protein
LRCASVSFAAIIQLPYRFDKGTTYMYLIGCH